MAFIWWCKVPAWCAASASHSSAEAASPGTQPLAQKLDHMRGKSQLFHMTVQTDHCSKWQNQCESHYSKYHAQFSSFATSIKISWYLWQNPCCKPNVKMIWCLCQETLPQASKFCCSVTNVKTLILSFWDYGSFKFKFVPKTWPWGHVPEYSCDARGDHSDHLFGSNIKRQPEHVPLQITWKGQVSVPFSRSQCRKTLSMLNMWFVDKKTQFLTLPAKTATSQMIILFLPCFGLPGTCCKWTLVAGDGRR